MSRQRVKNRTIKKSILHLGSGKVEPFETSDFHVHVDRGYKGMVSSLAELEDHHVSGGVGHFFIGCDLFEFLDAYKFKFDHIEAYRIFEHMEYCNGEIGRLVEACNMITTKNATMDIIVPNAEKLAQMLIIYENDARSNSKVDIIRKNNIKLILNSEFCNIKADPHGSIWTPALAKEYIEQEGTWNVMNVYPDLGHPYMGRDIYMRIVCGKKHMMI